MDWENVEGNDVAGYVEAVGAGVTKFKKGDKVSTSVSLRRVLFAHFAFFYMPGCGVLEDVHRNEIWRLC